MDLSSRPFRITTEFGTTTLLAETVVIATGAYARKLTFPGSETYWNKGISACAVCDGAAPIFRNRPVFVIGGGDSACEEALFLTKYASKARQLWLSTRRLRSFAWTGRAQQPALGTRLPSPLQEAARPGAGAAHMAGHLLTSCLVPRFTHRST